MLQRKIWHRSAVPNVTIIGPECGHRAPKIVKIVINVIIVVVMHSSSVNPSIATGSYPAAYFK